MNKSDLTKLEQFVFGRLAASNVPGLSLALIDGDKTIWSRGFGYRDVSRGLPATADTLYAIGSVTKSFTGVAMLQLAEQGKLSLDDDVSKHLPEFKVKPFGQKIKLRHFLSHSSGIPGLGFSEARFKQAILPGSLWLPVESHAAILHFMEDAHDWVAAKPGQRYFYLNEGFILVGAVLERVTGVAYNDYIKQNILLPLRMERSTFEFDDFMAAEDHATPYMISEGKQLPKKYTFNPVNAKGGLLSSVNELARYVRMHINAGALEGVRVMTAASSKQQQSSQIRVVEEKMPFNDNDYGFGLALTEDFFGHKMVGHGGSVSISTSYIGFVPKLGVGVAVISNGTGYAISRYGQVALAALMGEDPRELPFLRQEELYAELSGEYHGYHKTTQVQVSAAGDYLNLRLVDDRGPQPAVPLMPVTLDKDRCTFSVLSDGIPMTVEFLREKGRITVLFERYAYRKMLP